VRLALFTQPRRREISEVRIAPVLLLGGHGPEWGVAAGARQSLIGLLRECAPQLGVCSVVLDPPASLRGGEAPPAVALIPIEEFLDRLETAE
jgi:hypothetical protein